MNDLTGLVAVVTGGNGGIGLGMATGIAKAGGDIAIWARDAAKSADAVKRLTDLAVKAIALPVDVTDEAQVGEVMERTVAELGPLGCMIAPPGPGQRARPGLDPHRPVRGRLPGRAVPGRHHAPHPGPPLGRSRGVREGRRLPGRPVADLPHRRRDRRRRGVLRFLTRVASRG